MEPSQRPFAADGEGGTWLEAASTPVDQSSSIANNSTFDDTPKDVSTPNFYDILKPLAYLASSEVQNHSCYLVESPDLIG